MSFVSIMQITVKPGMRDHAVAAFVERRVFEECPEVIPGFIKAQLLEAQGSPDSMSVIAEWQVDTDYHEWVAYPVRASQDSDMAHFLAEAPLTTLYRTREGKSVS